MWLFLHKQKHRLFVNLNHVDLCIEKVATSTHITGFSFYENLSYAIYRHRHAHTHTPLTLTAMHISYVADGVYVLKLVHDITLAKTQLLAQLFYLFFVQFSTTQRTHKHKSNQAKCQ